jgi:signal peptidase I
MLPPASTIKTAVAQNVKSQQAPNAQTEQQVKKGWSNILFSQSSPAAAAAGRRLAQSLHPPSWLRRWIWRLFFLGPPIAVIYMSFPWTIMRVHGVSMAPFFNPNSSPDLPSAPPDLILVQTVHSLGEVSPLFRIPKFKLQRGQVVVYYTPHDPNTIAVKRVVGLPGDKVTPLPGYSGGDDSPVIIPYNHIWVEGDANSRDKSIDSNHFGPISQNLVCGFVLAVYVPGLNWPVWLDRGAADTLATKAGRVEMDVVGSARLDPDEQAMQSEDPFRSGAAALELAMIRRNRELMPAKLRAKGMLERYRRMHALAEAEVEKADASTRSVAEGLLEELEIAFESVGLNKDGGRVAPVVKPRWRTDEEGESAADKERRLQEYLLRQRTA